MKIAILLFFYSVFAFSAPPMGVSGRDDSSNLYPSVIKAPFKQVTNLGAGKAQIETGNKNRLANPGFEHSTVNSGWTSAATGTATIGTGADTETPLEGAKSLTIQCIGGASGGTCTIYQDVTTSYVIQGLVSALVSTDTPWNGTSGARLHHRSNGATSDSLYTDILDVSPIRHKIPSLFGTTSTGIALVITAAASQTINVEIDDASVSTDAGIADVSVITPWTNGTCSGTWTTNTTYACKYRQVGQNLEVSYSISLSGAPNATGLYINLPSGFSADTSKMAGATNLPPVFGSGGIYDSSAGAYYVSEVYYESTGGRLQPVYSLTTDQMGEITATAPVTFATGDKIQGAYSIPVTQFSGSTQVFASNCGANCENEFSAKVSSTGAVSQENLDWISGNCSNPSAGTFNCTKNSNIPSALNYSVTAYNTSTGDRGCIITSETASTFQVTCLAASVGTGENNDFYLVAQKQGADYQSSRTIVGSFKDVPTTQGSSGSDIQSVYFGSGADCASACTTGTCTICHQIGTKITSVTWSATGQYNLNGIDNYKYNCDGTGFVNATSAYFALLHGRTGGSASFARVQTGGTSSGDVSYASVTCTGIK